MKKFTFKTLSILLAAVLLAASLPITTFAEDISPCVVLQCDHEYDKSSYKTCTYFSDEYHITTQYYVQYCSLCGLEDTVETGSYYESHDIEESSYKTYSPGSDEYHITTEHIYETCICCGMEINFYEIDSNETHVFEASVDPEVDMEGVCIYCGETIYW